MQACLVGGLAAKNLATFHFIVRLEMWSAICHLSEACETMLRVQRVVSHTRYRAFARRIPCDWAQGKGEKTIITFTARTVPYAWRWEGWGAGVLGCWGGRRGLAYRACLNSYGTAIEGPLPSCWTRKTNSWFLELSAWSGEDGLASESFAVFPSRL